LCIIRERPGERKVVKAAFSTDPAALARAAVEWDGRAQVYVTLNPVDPEMPARGGHPLNRISPKWKPLAQASDILRRLRLLLDFDPTRRGKDGEQLNAKHFS